LYLLNRFKKKPTLTLTHCLVALKGMNRLVSLTELKQLWSCSI